MVIRLLTQLVAKIFAAVEQERLTLPGVYPDTAASDPADYGDAAVALRADRVVSLSARQPVGGVQGHQRIRRPDVSLGSSGVMNQAMSGLMVTYSRSLKCGEYVRIGTIEGTVTIGRHPGHQDYLAAQRGDHHPERGPSPHRRRPTSRRNAVNGTYSSTSVTIGYDTPWRQVHALLRIAATRTPGMRTTRRR